MMALTTEDLHATPEERIYAPQRRLAVRRDWGIALAAALFLYVALAAVALIEAHYAPPPVPEVAEIPVEIVVEAPPPPPEPTPSPTPTPPPTQAEKPPPPPPDEPRATDAPRAGTDEKVDSADAPDKAKPPPPTGVETPAETKAETPPAAEASPAPTPEPTAPPPIAEAPNAEATQPPPKPPVPPPSPQPTQPLTPAQKLAKAVGRPIPLFDSLPEVDFGGAALKSPVSGGNARATYLSQIYGLVMPRFRQMRGRLAAFHAHEGRVVFNLDGRGQLVTRFVAEESGSRELDAAAFDAIAAAAPFPPPPSRGPVSIIFSYRSD